MFLNRLTSDGTIAEFRKDGTTVGSIGTKDGDVYIGTGDTALAFYDAGSFILPYNTSTSGYNDNSTTLGNANYRFKDLYLSGGAYLGGTAVANKLDDYEEGTFDVTLAPATSGTITLNTTWDTMTYTKVGRVVTVNGLLLVDSASSPVGATINLTGLPFTSYSGTGDQASAGAGFDFYDGSGASHTITPWYIQEGSTSAVLYLASTLPANGDQLRFSFSYLAA
jgi:hypothetical protein